MDSGLGKAPPNPAQICERGIDGGGEPIGGRPGRGPRWGWSSIAAASSSIELATFPIAGHLHGLVVGCLISAPITGLVVDILSVLGSRRAKKVLPGDPCCALERPAEIELKVYFP